MSSPPLEGSAARTQGTVKWSAGILLFSKDAGFLSSIRCAYGKGVWRVHMAQLASRHTCAAFERERYYTVPTVTQVVEDCFLFEYVAAYTDQAAECVSKPAGRELQPPSFSCPCLPFSRRQHGMVAVHAAGFDAASTVCCAASSCSSRTAPPHRFNI